MHVAAGRDDAAVAYRGFHVRGDVRRGGVGARRKQELVAANQRILVHTQAVRHLGVDAEAE